MSLEKVDVVECYFILFTLELNDVITHLEWDIMVMCLSGSFVGGVTGSKALFTFPFKLYKLKGRTFKAIHYDICWRRAIHQRVGEMQGRV